MTNENNNDNNDNNEVETEEYSIHEESRSPYYHCAKFIDMNTGNYYYIIPTQKHDLDYQLQKIVEGNYGIVDRYDLQLVSVQRHKRASTTFRAPEFKGKYV